MHRLQPDRPAGRAHLLRWMPARLPPVASRGRQVCQGALGERWGGLGRLRRARAAADHASCTRDPVQESTACIVGRNGCLKCNSQETKCLKCDTSKQWLLARSSGTCVKVGTALSAPWSRVPSCRSAAAAPRPLTCSSPRVLRPRPCCSAAPPLAPWHPSARPATVSGAPPPARRACPPLRSFTLCCRSTLTHPSLPAHPAAAAKNVRKCSVW